MNKTNTTLVRDGATKVLRLLVRFRFAVLVTLIIGYFVFAHKRSIPFSANNPSGNAPQSESAQLYNPASLDANPKWSLPVELSSKDLRDLSQQVDKLRDDMKQLRRLTDNESAFSQFLLDPAIKGLLWPRLHGSGFADPKLPLDWYNLVQDKYRAIDLAANAVDDERNRIELDKIDERLNSIQIRLIGGQVLTGDLSGAKSIRSYIDKRLPVLSTVVPKLKDVIFRLNTEFPDEMGNKIMQLSKQYPSEFEKMFMSAAQIEASRDFNYNGLRSLTMGLNIYSFEQMDNNSSRLVSVDADTFIRTVQLSDHWLSLGSYLFTSGTAKFHAGTLDELIFTFDTNRHDIFLAFQKRFSPLHDRADWTEDSVPMRAKLSDEESGLVGIILAPKDTNRPGVPQWNKIRLISGQAYSRLHYGK